MASPPIVEDADIAARRAKTRIGVAVVLLAIALGGLALLSRNNKTHTEPAESPVSGEKQESVSSPPAPQAPAQISSEQQEPPPPPTATPETSPATTAQAPAEPPPPPPPAPVVSKLPPEPSHIIAPVAPHAAAPVSPKPVTEKPVSAKPAQPQSEQPTTKQAAAPTEKPIPVATKQAKSEPKSYEVQVGVFTDMENAKQLQAKLAEHGIPSHTETKLQIGPFSSKAEADAAQAKLKALGMGAVIVPGK